MYIKICGLTAPEHVATAVACGADAIGFVFAPGSPRTLSPQAAAELGNGASDMIETVGVFRNQALDDVLRIARLANVTTVQLHGSEPLSDAAALTAAGFRVLRAFSAPQFAALNAAEREGWSQYRLLIDAIEPGAGETFDAAALTTGVPQGFWLLAGGLTPTNVAPLVRQMQPHGVDVSSGVEVSRGVKSSALIEAFIAAARTASEV